MMHAMTTVTRSTKAYMNLAKPECAQLQIEQGCHIHYQWIPDP